MSIGKGIFEVVAQRFRPDISIQDFDIYVKLSKGNLQVCREAVDNELTQ